MTEVTTKFGLDVGAGGGNDGLEDEDNTPSEVNTKFGLDVGTGGTGGGAVGILVELVLTTTVGPGVGAEFIPSRYDIELPGFMHVEHRFELGDQDSAGEYTIDGSVFDTVTFAANTLWCACSQQHRRTVKRSTVVHILVDDVLFISEIEKN